MITITNPITTNNNPITKELLDGKNLINANPVTANANAVLMYESKVLSFARSVLSRAM